MPQWVTNLLAELPQIAADIAAIVAAIAGGTATAADVERYHVLRGQESQIMATRDYFLNVAGSKLMDYPQSPVGH